MRRPGLVLVIALLAASVLLAGAAWVQQGPPGSAWWVFGSGGGQATAGALTVRDTLGQAIVGRSGGGNVGLEAGCWQGLPGIVHLPLIER